MILVIGWFGDASVRNHFFKDLLFKVLIPQYDGIVAGVLQLIVCYVSIFLNFEVSKFRTHGLNSKSHRRKLVCSVYDRTFAVLKFLILIIYGLQYYWINEKPGRCLTGFGLFMYRR